MEARLTDTALTTRVVRLAPAADRTPIRSLLRQTYDRNPRSQKTLFDEELTMRMSGRLGRL
jgi:hypothetical protein